MIKLEVTGKESFVVRADEPMRIVVGYEHGVLIAHAYAGAEDDEDQEPVFAFDSSVKNVDVTHSDRAYVAVIDDGGRYRLGMADRGEPGYTPTGHGPYPSWTAAKEAQNRLNAKLGLEPEEAFKIIASTMSRQ